MFHADTVVILAAADAVFLPAKFVLLLAVALLASATVRHLAAFGLQATSTVCHLAAIGLLAAATTVRFLAAAAFGHLAAAVCFRATTAIDLLTGATVTVTGADSRRASVISPFGTDRK
jgi:hypothetical protein